MKKIDVKYFALFREQADKATEAVQTGAVTAKDLYRELSVEYQFTLQSDQIRVSINEEFAPADAVLADGDHVVFIPPVAGG